MQSADLIVLNRATYEPWLNNSSLVDSKLVNTICRLCQRAYGLKCRSLHFESNEEISHKLWHDLEHELDRNACRWMVWEDIPLETSVEKLKITGIQSVVFIPCADKPAGGDCL